MVKAASGGPAPPGLRSAARATVAELESETNWSEYCSFWPDWTRNTRRAGVQPPRPCRSLPGARLCPCICGLYGGRPSTSLRSPTISSATSKASHASARQVLAATRTRTAQGWSRCSSLADLVPSVGQPRNTRPLEVWRRTVRTAPLRHAIGTSDSTAGASGSGLLFRSPGTGKATRCPLHAGVHRDPVRRGDRLARSRI